MKLAENSSVPLDQFASSSAKLCWWNVALSHQADQNTSAISSSKQQFLFHLPAKFANLFLAG
jgi:hypothetical protein